MRNRTPPILDPGRSVRDARKAAGSGSDGFRRLYHAHLHDHLVLSFGWNRHCDGSLWRQRRSLPPDLSRAHRFPTQHVADPRDRRGTREPGRGTDSGSSAGQRRHLARCQTHPSLQDRGLRGGRGQRRAGARSPARSQRRRVPNIRISDDASSCSPRDRTGIRIPMLQPLRVVGSLHSRSAPQGGRSHDPSHAHVFLDGNSGSESVEERDPKVGRVHQSARNLACHRRHGAGWNPRCDGCGGCCRRDRRRQIRTAGALNGSSDPGFESDAFRFHDAPESTKPLESRSVDGTVLRRPGRPRRF